MINTSILQFYKMVQKLITSHLVQGYNDFTKTRNEDMKSSYIARHKVREDWSKSGILTAGFWSRWILWNKPTIKESVKYTIKKFHLI